MADKFFDMWVPAALDRMVTRYWQRQVDTYKPKELIGTAELLVDDGILLNNHPFFKRVHRDMNLISVVNTILVFALCYGLQQYDAEVRTGAAQVAEGVWRLMG